MKIYKFNILLVISLFAMVSLTTCKKYPEDHKLSFETADNRLKELWILTQCLVDGDDVTDKEYTLIFNSLPSNDTTIYKLKDATLEFKYYKTRNNPQHSLEKKHESYLSIKTIIKHRYAVPISFSKYEFKNQKKNINFNSNTQSSENFPLLFNYSNEPWTIKKLTKTAFIIETTNDIGNKIKVTFKGG